jgi:hypothetical protein
MKPPYSTHSTIQFAVVFAWLHFSAVGVSYDVHCVSHISCVVTESEVEYIERGTFLPQTSINEQRCPLLNKPIQQTRFRLKVFRMPSKFVFRVRSFPAHANLDDLKKALEKKLLSGEKLNLVPRDTAIVPSCPSQPNGARTILFSVQPPVPDFLERLVNQLSKTVILDIGDEDVPVDQHFYGFTQMYPTAEGQPIIAE